MNKDILKQFNEELDRPGTHSSFDQKHQALLSVAEKLRASAFSSSSPSSIFQARLKEKIAQSRQTGRSKKFSFARFADSFRSIFRLPYWRPALATMVLIAVVVTSFQIGPWWRNTRTNEFSKLLINTAYAQDNFTVEPTNADSIGIAKNSSFAIKSKQAIDITALQKNITLVPAIKFDLKKISDHEFKITPQEALQDNKVYRIYITSSYIDSAGVTIDRPYSWAFQVRDIFGVRSTLPADRSSAVPVNTGIEITFSHENIINYEQNFSIEPKAVGRFEKKGRTLIFIPSKPLQPATIYTVTLGKDIGVQNSTSTLGQEQVIQFETQPVSALPMRGVGSYSDSLAEFGPSNTPAVPVYYAPTDFNPSNPSPFPAMPTKVFRFASVQNFLDALEKKEAGPTWARYYDAMHLTPTTGLTQVASFEGAIQKLGYRDYLVFPEALPPGFYVAQTKFGAQNSEVFLQITNLTTYITASEASSFIWVNDLANGQPVSGATITTNAQQLKLMTDSRGVASFNAKDLFKDKKQNSYLLVKSSESAIVVEVQNQSYQQVADEYWKYMYTDRQLYKSNDTVKVWGMIKPRQNKSLPRDIKLELIANGGAIYAEQKISLQENGVFNGSIKLENVKADYYQLVGSTEEGRIVTGYLQVENYSKPAYQIEVQSNKKAVFAGEKVIFDIKASFFDGTPVPRLPVKFGFGDKEGTLTLDDQGRARVELSPEYKACKEGQYCSYPTTNSFLVSPVNSEEALISGFIDVRIFGPRTMIIPTTKPISKQMARIRVDAYQISLDKINTGKESIYGEYKGAIAPNTPVTAEINEISYNRIEQGEVYDFINKKTIQQYRYEQTKKLLTTISGTTNALGVFEKDFSIDPDKSYQIIIKTRDSEGRVTEMLNFISTSEQYNHLDMQDFYVLQLADPQKSKFKIGEKVQLNILENGRPLTAKNSTGSFLFYRIQQGVRDFVTQSVPAYEFIFTEEEIPNVHISGVWFDGRVYRPLSMELVSYDASEKELQISVVSDKDHYAPGEEVVLKARVKDKQGNPVSASLNFNLVDEAFYKLSYEVADPLGKLYQTIEPNIYYTSYSHKNLSPRFSSGAEHGGCFLEGTKVLMADGSERSIQDIKDGDKVATFRGEFSYELVPANVVTTYRHIVQKYLIINNRLFVTPEHRVFVNGTWRQIGEAKAGDWLLDQNGNKVIIDSIESRQEVVRVYNLQVDNYHTFIANGIYVHNDKGGERQSFVDVALFKSVETDNNGQAEIKFTLPDNITSWQVTTQGITSNLYAGVSAIKIPVSLPLFAHTTIAQDYLISDQPVIKTSAFGESLKSGDIVKFGVESKTLPLPLTNLTAKAFESVYLALPALRLGQQKVAVIASSTNYSDILSRTFNVIPSRVQQTVREYAVLKEGLRIAGSTTGRTNLLFTDHGRGRLYEHLVNFSHTSRDRVDSRLAALLSLQARQKYFSEEQLLPDVAVWSKYQSDEGGISLLPYSSNDLELSAKIAFAAPEKFDKVGLKNYFYTVLQKKESSREDLAEALLGLASLNESVLFDIQSLSKVPDLTVREKLYLSWAALAIGDNGLARQLYHDVLEHNAVENRPYVKINAGQNEELNTELTAIAAIIGAGINDRHADSLLNYIGQHSAALTQLELEQVLAISQRLPYLNSAEARFTATINGQSKEYYIPSNGQVSLSLTPYELASLSFSKVSGDIASVSYYLAPVKNTQQNTASPLTLRREFYSDGQKTNSFKQTDLVEVRLYPSISADAMDGSYQITDYVPSGLRVITPQYLSGAMMYGSDQNSDCALWYPYEIDGQTVKYSLDKNWRTSRDHCKGIDYVKYYARVVTPGSYTAEPASIEHFTSENIRNYTSPDRITISY